MIKTLLLMGAHDFGRSSAKPRSWMCLLLAALCAVSFCHAVYAAEIQESPTGYGDDFSKQYTALTKEVLLAGIELERFSLNYRMESVRQQRFRRLRYFLAQETGASCELAFEATAIKQFGIGRRRPLRVNQRALGNALKAGMTGSIIAGSGSCLELAYNALQALKSKRHGFDTAAANRYVAAKLKRIDDLLVQRDALVAANSDHPAYMRAVVEGKVLREMRAAFINEYAHFNADSRSYLAFQNLFFLLNAGFNAIGATGFGLANKGLTEPKLNGPANILFIVGGGLATVTPLLSSAYAALIRKHAYSSLAEQLHEKPHFEPAELTAQRKTLEEHLGGAEGSLIPSLPATGRLALYTESDELFRKQLDSETRVMRHLEKVALETSILGPAIGGTLMTQGILGAVGFYKYGIRIRKQFRLNYYGAIVGSVGASMAVVGNAAWLLASLSYEHHLAKRKRLPAQLIEQRLSHLEETEKIVRSL